MEEIVTSEKAYIKQLERLIIFFVNPLKDLIDLKSHTALFGQLELIYNLNKELLLQLETNLEQLGEEFGNAFYKMAPFFKLYSVYAFDYKNSLISIQNLSTKNPVFRRFIEGTESRPEVQAKLNSLMIVPIQRVPRYCTKTILTDPNSNQIFLSDTNCYFSKFCFIQVHQIKITS